MSNNRSRDSPRQSASGGNVHELHDEVRQDPRESTVLLSQLISQLISGPISGENSNMDTEEPQGCSQEFIDSLPRITARNLIEGDECSICCSKYNEDDYPLVVELPHCSHRFDLECLTPWLLKNSTCPLCRDDVMEKVDNIDVSNVELEEDWGMYG